MNADKEVCKPFNYMASPGTLSKHSKGPEAVRREGVHVHVDEPGASPPSTTCSMGVEGRATE